MPTYQYRCAKCGEQFELWQSIHDDALQKHPGCGGKVTKVLSPAGIVLKGPGFYRTDNRSSSGRGGREKEKAEKSESKSETKSDSSSSNGSGGKDSSSSKSSEKSSSKKDASAK
jgi:putative FmdB family regulatory protein